MIVWQAQITQQMQMVRVIKSSISVRWRTTLPALPPLPLPLGAGAASAFAFSVFAAALVTLSPPKAAPDARPVPP